MQDQVEIATHKLPYGFDDLVDLALHVESCLSLRRQCMAVRSPWRVGELTSDPSPVLPLPSPDDPKPMQLGRLCLTLQQKQEQFTRGLYFYFGRAGYFVNKCLLKARAHQYSGGSWWALLPLFPPPHPNSLFPVTVQFGGYIYSCSALVDSGAGGNLMDSGMTEKWGIPANPLPNPISVRSLDDSPFTIITHVPPP